MLDLEDNSRPLVLNNSSVAALLGGRFDDTELLQYRVYLEAPTLR